MGCYTAGGRLSGEYYATAWTYMPSFAPRTLGKSQGQHRTPRGDTDECIPSVANQKGR